MNLSRESGKKFEAIYKKEFGEEIDEKTANDIAGRLLNLFKAVYGPKEKKYENSQFPNN